MRLGEIWDYFMRRKLLLLLVIAVSTLVGVLSYRLCFGKTEESVSVDIPRTGESVVERNEAKCVVELALLDDGSLSGGVNQSELGIEADEEITFWGAEAPDADIKIPQPDSDNSAKPNTESLIITAGVVATVAVIFLAKFIFDHYVR